jgi:SP family arabinose:H+ symporter-like MFS transporter
MHEDLRYVTKVAVIVALGGFLMGFDASVISGVVRFIERRFELGKIELGWSVASLTLAATFAMMISGPLSDRLGRRAVLRLAALLFTGSAILSAIAPTFPVLVVARMIGGLGVGAALIVAPMYIAELAPARIRGRMVSLNQLNIVVGISAAFFSNYLVLKFGQSDASWSLVLRLEAWNWRWMLGLETLPAVLYFVALTFVPESPRWLVMHGRDEEALAIMARIADPEGARADLESIRASTAVESSAERPPLQELFGRSMRRVVTIGVIVAVLQQITGINAVFFYAPMIFEQSGIGIDAAFMQAILVGLVNLLFTVLAILLIDRVGRKPLLVFGVSGMAACMLFLGWSFHSATYALSTESVAALPDAIDRAALRPLVGTSYDSDLAYKEAIVASLGSQVLRDHESELVGAAIDADPALVLIGILGFVASFAVSIGPVMWVLFSELFPNRIRGLAVSFVGLINSAVSFLAQFLFPWEIATWGSATTFFLYGAFAVVGLVLVLRLLPETKGRSLEHLEQLLVRPAGSG